MILIVPRCLFDSVTWENVSICYFIAILEENGTYTIVKSRSGETGTVTLAEVLEIATNQLQNWSSVPLTQIQN